MRTIRIAYDTDGNVEYWGQEDATGGYAIRRFYYDASDNLVTIKDGRQGAWANRENLDWN